MSDTKRNVIFCGVLTVSDGCAAGVAEDLSGPNLQTVLQEFPGFKAIVTLRKIVPDELPAIKETLIDWCDKERVNLILTTGGTGISPRDVTPEATLQVIEKELNAIVIGMIAASLAKTRFSMLTRLKCGIRGRTLIVNFPGSKSVAEKCLRYILPILNHANDVLNNNLRQVDTFHLAAEACGVPVATSTNPGQVSAGASSNTSTYQPVTLPDIRQGNVDLRNGSPETCAISPGTHVVAPNSHIVPPDEHVVPPGSHVIPPESHVIPPESHVIPPDMHVILPGSHVIPPVTHLVSPNAHLLPPFPDTRVISSDRHEVAPNTSGLPQDEVHHVSPLQHHEVLSSEILKLDSATIERELESEGLLSSRSPLEPAEKKYAPTEQISVLNVSARSVGIPTAIITSTIQDSPFIGRQKIALKLAADKRKINPDFYLPAKVAKRDRESPYPLVSMEKSVATVLEQTPVLPVITLPYEDALGFVLAKDIISPESIPQFPVSIKDGYAVIAVDTPGELQVVGLSIYGVCKPDSTLKRGQSIRITTGSPIPQGADAIVQVEDTKLLEDAKGGEIEVRISVLKKVSVGQDIRSVGSDIRRGELVLRAGTVFGPCEIGILASIGNTQVQVYRKPTVAVMSTGNELTDPGFGPLEFGQVRDSNRKALLSALKQAGFATVDIGIILDDPNKIKLSLETALDTADVVISSGGVSVGERDFVKAMIKAVGGTIHFGRVLMKPGKPTTFASVKTTDGKKLIFALPGNPVSSIVTFNLFTLPALKKMSGFSNPNATLIKARVETGMRLDSRPEYQRCTIKWKPGDSTPWAVTTGSQVSSRLTSMVNANALVTLPPKSENCSEVVRGDLVDALLIDRL